MQVPLPSLLIGQEIFWSDLTLTASLFTLVNMFAQILQSYQLNGGRGGRGDTARHFLTLQSITSRADISAGGVTENECGEWCERLIQGINAAVLITT